MAFEVLIGHLQDAGKKKSTDNIYEPESPFLHLPSAEKTIKCTANTVWHSFFFFSLRRDNAVVVPGVFTHQEVSNKTDDQDDGEDEKSHAKGDSQDSCPEDETKKSF